MPSQTEKDAAIAGLHSYRAKLKADMDRLAQDLRAVERSIQLLGGKVVEVSADEPVAPGVGYSGLGPQAAVERLLSECPDKRFKPSAVAKELLRRGFQARGKTYASQVSTSLNRAAAKGFATKERANGRWVFGLNTQEHADQSQTAQ
jgi:hypothetical protein